MTELALLVLLAQSGASGAARPVIVESATACPTAEEVEARLQLLLPPAVAGAPAKRARVTAEEGELRVHLDAAEGRSLGDRTVAVEASCADRANVVAVVIAAWDAQHRAEEVQAPTLPHPTGPSALAVTAEPAAGAPAPLSLEVVAGPAMTLTSDGLSPAAMVALSAWRGWVGARLGLSGFAPRTEDVGAGSARWSRAGVSFELGLRLSGRAGRLDAHAGLMAGLLTARGSGFAIDQTETRLVPAATAGLDASRAFGRLLLGLDVSGAAFNQQTLVDASSPMGRALPRLQLTLALHAGISF